jgi:hypothetical protein
MTPRSATKSMAMKQTPTAYTFGYWGWGTNTERLVKLAAEWEEKAGRLEPLWVDIRWSRSVRAPGFRDAGFARSTGEALYRWMQGLGNSAIGVGGMTIADPAEASRLLDAILEAHEKRRRVIFFCACEFVREDGELACHRGHVANLVLAAARQGGQALAVQEWPGGDPERHTFEVDDRHLCGWDGFALAAERLPASAPILVPQATAFCLRGKTEELVAFLRTPVYAKGWRHRLLWTPLPAMSDTAVERKQRSLRKKYGLEQLLASDARTAKSREPTRRRS